MSNLVDISENRDFEISEDKEAETEAEAKTNNFNHACYDLEYQEISRLRTIKSPLNIIIQDFKQSNEI